MTSNPNKTMIAEQVESITSLAQTMEDTSDYTERLLRGELSCAERDAVYNSVFITKTDKDGRSYIDHTDKSFDYVAMRDYMINCLDIVVFSSREIIAMPKRAVAKLDGRYVPLSPVMDAICNYATMGIATENSVKKAYYATINDMRLRVHYEDMQTNTRRANFANGVVDISGDNVVFVPHTEEDMFFTRVPHDYPVDGGECPVFQTFLDYALDPKYHQFIYEWIGYCFFETYEFQHIIFHHGVGGSGKSTLLKMVSAVLGASNVGSVSLHDAKKAFSLIQLEGKMANHGSEASYKDMKDGKEVLKQLSSGVDPILVEQKYEKAYPIINTAKLTYVMNQLSRIYEDDSGLWRRLILVEWGNVMDIKTGRRFNSTENGMFTPDEISGVLFQSVKAFHTMIERGDGFSYAPTPTDVERDYMLKSNPIGAFIEECIEFSDVHSTSYRASEAEGDGDWEATSDIYMVYTKWCGYEDMLPDTPRAFAMKLSKAFEKEAAIRKTYNHDGGKQVRGWKHIRINQPSTNTIQVVI